jgi:hypothetical protein
MVVEGGVGLVALVAVVVVGEEEVEVVVVRAAYHPLPF